MQNTHRSLLLAAIITAAAALAPHSASAANKSVNVPFSFMASGRQCPAGAYNVQLEKMNQVLRLTSPSGHVNLVWLAGPGNPNPNDQRIVLRFDQAGSTYTLRSVQYGAAVTSRLDKNIRAQQPPTEILGQ
ncbi:MAG TPA: hypothetical protein VF730_03955 [Terracidiphilus sp.]